MGWHRFRFALFFTLAIHGCIAAADLVLLPLYEKGVMQELLCYPNRLSHMLAIPGRALLAFSGFSPASMARLPLSLALYFLAGHALRLFCGWLRDRRPSHQPSLREQPDPPIIQASISRRRLLQGGTQIAAAGAAASATGAFFYCTCFEPRSFIITSRTIPIRGLHPELDGLRIVHLTDIHHGPWISLNYVRRIVEAANDLRPDLILLTGDYVSRSAAYIVPVANVLSGLSAKIGSIAVLGNHDWWEDAPLMARELRRAGAWLADNTRFFVDRHRMLTAHPPASLFGSTAPAADALCIAGVGDLWEDRQDYAAALGNLPDGMPRLLLSHNPDVAEEPALRSSGLRIDLILSGHTHGGQVCLPALGTPILPSRYGQKYASGLVQGPTAPVFISAGLGMAMLPLRFGVPPELAVLELRASPQIA